MKSSVEDPQGTANQDAQQASVPEVDADTTVPEWSSDLLLTLHSQVRFTRADWP
ncbi:hypothetical protein [Pseudarthrobacter sp. lyk4-40-TYG-27]|uniref:hypothetical protein n=1 Tax=Pseudarthrobacter sp. lyk4-40-TYG-27 TaxID=3040305 RepID=UPI002552C17E|nr:hypothetical protein [Pseudarthrobacter sp. lyk4-40-TYG-27]